jgi:RES domain-containing protein
VQRHELYARVADLETVTWSGNAWRSHKRKFLPLDATGSTIASGRFHRAPDEFPAHECWSALYFSLKAEISLAEIIRHTHPTRMFTLNELRITEVKLTLQSVIDIRNPQLIGLAPKSLLDDLEYSITQTTARAVLDRGAEGIIVPSATQLGANLVVFPDNLKPGSSLEVIMSRDPVLYVERD